MIAVVIAIVIICLIMLLIIKTISYHEEKLLETKYILYLHNMESYPNEKEYKFCNYKKFIKKYISYYGTKEEDK